MNKQNNDEKEFRNDLDCLVAGEQPTPHSSSDPDYQKNVRFADKMLKSRIEPSPEFKTSLKQRLLLKLQNEEIKAERKTEKRQGFWEFVKNLVPKNPAWRTLAVTITVFAVAFIVVWQTGIFSEQAKPAMVGSTISSATTTQNLVEVKAVASKTTYKPGEPVNVTLTFQNTSREQLTLTTFPPTIVVAAPSLKPFKTIRGGEFRTISPGEIIEFAFSWDQRDNEGTLVLPGEYIIQMLDIELGDGQGLVTLPQSLPISIAAP